MGKSLQSIGGAMGGGGGGARPPIITPDSVRSEAKIEIIEAWQWGEMQGFPALPAFTPVADDPDPAGLLRCVYLDDTPVRSMDGSYNFDKAGIEFDYRLGTQDQSYMSGSLDFGNDAIGSPVSVGVPVVKNTPITRTINDASADAVQIILLWQSLQVSNPKTGDINAAMVRFRIEARPTGAGAWTTIVDPDFPKPNKGQMREKASSAFQYSHVIDLKALSTTTSSFDVRVTRISNDDAYNEQTAFSWDSYVKLTYAKFRRPNIAYCRLVFDAKYFSNIPKRSYLLHGTRVLVPTADVYNPTTRTYTGADWGGSLIKAYCNNPAWCLYYLLVTPGIGLGTEINPAYQDKWLIYQIAQRCDELVPDGNGGTEKRYSLNAQFMQQVSAHDMITQIAGAFDAMALWDGKSIYLAQDAPRNVSSLYMPANVINGRFMYSGTARQVRYTAAMIQYNDPTDLYRLQTEPVEDESGIDRYGYLPTTEAMIGCTSRAEAHRRGKRLLVSGRLELDGVTFNVGFNGITNRPGDVVRIADPLRSAGNRLGGRISTGSTTSAIKLDAPATLASGINYRLSVIGLDGNVWDTAITNSPGTYSTVNVSPVFAQAPEQDFEWIIYDPLAVGKLYRILSISENDTDESGYYSVSATQYDPAKYALIDGIGALPELPKNPYIVNAVVPPYGVTTHEGTIVLLEGIRRFLDISWSASTDALLQGYMLSYSINGAHVANKLVYGLSYRIDNPVTGEYEITLSAINLTGKYSASITVIHTVSDFYDITAIDIINLALPSGTTQFTGKDAFFTWDTTADAIIGLSDSYAQGKGGQKPFFRDFEVQIFDGATLLRTEYLTEDQYSYTFAKNTEDGGPRRSFTFKVRARDFYGNYSNQASITVSNPAPGAFGAINLVPGLGQVFVYFVPPVDPDYLLTRIYASTTNGFTPSAANLVTETAVRTAAFKTDLNGTYYVRLQGVDAFGLAGTTYSAQLSVVVYTDLTLAVDEVLADPGRPGDVIVEASRFLVVEPGQTAPVTSVFGVAAVDGVAKVAIHGDLLADGSIYGRSIVAQTISADKLLVNNLSAISADIGTCTAGTFKTSAVTTGYRVEMSSSGSWPIWYGTGTKNAGNALFYVDTTGSAFFGGSINVNGKFTVASDGTVSVKNADNQVIFSTGTGAEWTYVNGRPVDLTSLSATDGAKLTGIQDGATVGANADNLVVGVSGNMLPNSDFSAGIQGWQLVGVGSIYWDMLGTAWQPAGGHSLGIARSGTPATTSTIAFKTLPVAPNSRYEFSAYVASHRCFCKIRVTLLGADGVTGYLSYDFNRQTSNDNGGKNLSAWERVGGFFNTTASTTGFYIEFTVGVATGVDPFAWVTRMFLGGANAGQTELSPWSAGGSSGALSEVSQLTQSNIGTYMAQATIGELQILGGAVTVPEIATGAVTLSAPDTPTTLCTMYPVAVSIPVTRIVMITLQIASPDSDPGYLMLSLYKNGFVFKQWAFDVSGRLNFGTHEMTFTVTHPVDYPSNNTDQLAVILTAAQGSGTHLWPNPMGLNTQTKMTVFTGKR